MFIKSELLKKRWTATSIRNCYYMEWRLLRCAIWEDKQRMRRITREGTFWYQLSAALRSANTAKRWQDWNSQFPHTFSTVHIWHLIFLVVPECERIVERSTFFIRCWNWSRCTKWIKINQKKIFVDRKKWGVHVSKRKCYPESSFLFQNTFLIFMRNTCLWTNFLF